MQKLSIRTILKHLRSNSNNEVHNYNITIKHHDEMKDTFLLQDFLGSAVHGGGNEISLYKTKKIIKDMLYSNNVRLA